jgi:hypothetical protein
MLSDLQATTTDADIRRRAQTYEQKIRQSTGGPSISGGEVLAGLLLLGILMSTGDGQDDGKGDDYWERLQERDRRAFEEQQRRVYETFDLLQGWTD